MSNWGNEDFGVNREEKEAVENFCAFVMATHASYFMETTASPAEREKKLAAVCASVEASKRSFFKCEDSKERAMRRMFGDADG